jgi:hypothetical protein
LQDRQRTEVVAAWCVYSCRLLYPLDVLVYQILDATTSPDHPLGVAVDVFIYREDGAAKEWGTRHHARGL